MTTRPTRTPKDSSAQFMRLPAVRFERFLPGSIEQLWEFLTNTERLAGWFGHGVIEPRAGGAVNLLDGHIRGVVTQWQPPRLLIYSWNVFSPGIDHVEVYVRDIARAADWYSRALGLKEMARWDPGPVMIGAGSSKLALFRGECVPWNSSGELHISAGWRRVAWAVDRAGFEAAQKHLAALGIRFSGPQDHGRSQSIYFADPDGNPLEITWYV